MAGLRRKRPEASWGTVAADQDLGKHRDLDWTTCEEAVVMSHLGGDWLKAGRKREGEGRGVFSGFQVWAGPPGPWTYHADEDTEQGCWRGV